MKKKYLLFILTWIILFSLDLHGQVPQKFNYQAIVRDASGQLVANQNIGVRIKIHDQSPSGTVIYVEVSNKMTNDYGLLNLVIGNGPAWLGTFSLIDWTSGDKYLEIQIDVTGGINYIPLGTIQILSVPYAIYAHYADSSLEHQKLSINGRSLSISKGNSVLLNSWNDTTNELQTLSLVGDNLSISRGNTVALPYLRSQWWLNNGSSIYYNTGNVGIGTSNPLYNLDIFSNINTWANISTGSNIGFAGLNINKGSNTGITNGLITFQTGGTPKWNLGMIKDDNFSISHNSVNPDGTFYIDGTGRIGIGTSSPGVNLDIKSNISDFIRLTATDTAGWAGVVINKGSSTNYSNGSIVYMTNGNFMWFSGLLKNDDYTISKSWVVPEGSFYIKNLNSYVGINTTNPQTRLDLYDTSNAFASLNGSAVSANAGLFINKGANTLSTNALITWQTGSSNKWYVGMMKDDNFSINRTFGSADGTFYINGSTGFLGLGTTVPKTNLDVSDINNANASLNGLGPLANANLYINKGITGVAANALITWQTGYSDRWYAGLIKDDNYSISRTNASSDGTFFINRNNGFTGIGTTTPSTHLDLRDNTSATASFNATANNANAGVIINKGSTTASTNAIVTLQTGSVDRWYEGLIKDDNFSISRTNAASDGTFYINRATGYLGLGTISPAAHLDLRDGTNALAAFNATAVTANAGLTINKGSTTASTNGIVTWQTGFADRWYAGLIKDDNFSISRTNAASDGSFFINRGTGYVGINTNAPAYRLDIRDAANAYASLTATAVTANAGLYINKGTTTASTTGGITLQTNAVNKWFVGMIKNDNFAISLSNAADDGTFYIDHSTGNIGIGNVNPRNGIQINKNIRIPDFPIRFVSSTANYGTQIRQNSNYFEIDKIDSSANPSVITSLINIDFSAATLAFQPSVNNNINSGSPAFAWKYVYGFNAYVQTSDSRMKKDIQDLDYGLGTIMKLRPVSFHWLDNTQPERKIGFIAQEVENIVPEAVKHTYFTDEELNKIKAQGNETVNKDIYGMSYSDLIPVLVKAIQEQQQMINTLQKEVNDLKAKQGK